MENKMINSSLAYYQEDYPVMCCRCDAVYVDYQDLNPLGECKVCESEVAELKSVTEELNKLRGGTIK